MPALPRLFRRARSTRVIWDTLAAAQVTLNAIQASADAFPPLKSAASAVIVVLEMSMKLKSNKKGCTHITERSAQLLHDIWRQAKDFGVALPAEVKESVVQIEKLFNANNIFFEELEEENFFQRLARQEDNKSRVEKYGRLLDEAMLHFNMNLELSIHRLHLESAQADRKRHVAVLAISRKRHVAALAASKTSQAERVQLLTQIRRKMLFRSSSITI
ncbi:hypothetical protein B0H12DRAFT_1230996 [Mycena haematopus]|nr:hypothetical protein B0H12DRAFT_1230996 [Mycena haematopus]